MYALHFLLIARYSTIECSRLQANAARQDKTAQNNRSQEKAKQSKGKQSKARQRSVPRLRAVKVLNAANVWT